MLRLGFRRSSRHCRVNCNWDVVQVVYMALVGSFPFNAFLSGVLSCIGTSVLGGIAAFQIVSCGVMPFWFIEAWPGNFSWTQCLLFGTVCLRMQVNPANSKEFKVWSTQQPSLLLMWFFLWRYLILAHCLCRIWLQKEHSQISCCAISFCIWLSWTSWGNLNFFNATYYFSIT